MALAAGVHPAALGSIVTGGVVALAPVYVAVVFGALLGRVTLEPASRARWSTSRPNTAARSRCGWRSVLCAVVALLFTSLVGSGRDHHGRVGRAADHDDDRRAAPVAATLFLMAFALGFIFNAANWTFYTNVLRRRANPDCSATRSCWPRSTRSRWSSTRALSFRARARVRDLGGSRETGRAASACRRSR